MGSRLGTAAPPLLFSASPFQPLLPPRSLPHDLWAPFLLESLLSELLSEDWPLLTSAGSEIGHMCPVNCHKRRFLSGSAAVGTRHCKAFSLDVNTGPTLDVQGELGRDV